MKDLINLNRRIATHWLGTVDPEQEAYLNYAAVCLAPFPHSAADIVEFLAQSKCQHHNSLSVAKLNRQYLRFARLAAKDVASGRLEMLITLGINLEQAEVLANLTNEDVTRVAFGWDGPIVRFPSRIFTSGAALHARAAKHHAAAFVATALVT